MKNIFSAVACLTVAVVLFALVFGYTPEASASPSAASVTRDDRADSSPPTAVAESPTAASSIYQPGALTRTPDAEFRQRHYRERRIFRVAQNFSLFTSNRFARIKPSDSPPLITQAFSPDSRARAKI